MRMEATLESLLDSVDLAEDLTLRIASGAGFDEEERHRIGMAVREALINALAYGSQFSREKKILLTLEVNAEKLVIEVLDEGPGFDLKDVPDPLAEENLLKSSGRGILLIRAFMDDFEVRRGREGGADVMMTKRLPAPRAP
jgi:serine/threonine-protein kinase RsbW